MNIASQTRDDSISLAELIGHLVQHKWWIVLLTITFATAGGIVAWMVPKKYAASIIIAPVSSSSSGGQLGGLATLASQSGLSGLAGISLSGDSKRWETLAVLESAALTQRYIQSNNLLPVLFSDEWDAQAKGWTTADPAEMPTLWKANELFYTKIRRVALDSKTGLVTMTITWTDPVLAAKWANELVALTNRFLRDKAIADSQNNISYLNAEANSTQVVGVRETIYKILENEINKAMLARGSEEYALRVLDPALAPEDPSTPAPWVWVLGGVFASLGLSVFIAFVLVVWRRND